MHKSSVHWVIDGGSFFGGRVVLTGIVHIVFSVAPIAESQQRVISLKNVPGKVQKSWFYRVIDEDFFFASDIRPALISYYRLFLGADSVGKSRIFESFFFFKKTPTLNGAFCCEPTIF